MEVSVKRSQKKKKKSQENWPDRTSSHQLKGCLFFTAAENSKIRWHKYLDINTHTYSIYIYIYIYTVYIRFLSPYILFPDPIRVDKELYGQVLWIMEWSSF